MNDYRPKSKRFGRHTYRYYYLKESDPNSPDHDGFVLYDPKKIYIAENPEYSMIKTVAHEDLHASFYENGIRDLDKHFEHALIEIVAEYIEKYYVPKKL